MFDTEAKWAAGDSALNYSSANLHRDEHGRLWAKDWTTGDVYVHQFIRVVEPAVLAMEEGRVYDGAELGAVAKLDDRAAEERAEGIAEADARAASLASLRARWEKKKAKADALSVEAVKAAEKAVKLGNTYLTKFRGHYAVSFGIAPRAVRCGFNLATQHVQTGKGGSYRRPCGELSCGDCGPHVLATKLGAILAMPVLEDGKVAGAALGQRPAYLRIVAGRDELGAFQDGFLKAIKKGGSSSKGSKEYDPKRGTLRGTPAFRDMSTLHDFGKHGWVAFDLENGGKVAIISSIPVGKKGLDKPLREAARIEDVIWRLVLRTYRAVAAGVDENGIEMPAQVTGKITSSRGLVLDPAEIKRIATASSWMAVGKAEPAKLKEALEARSVVVHATELGEDLKARKIVTAEFVEPATMHEAVASVGDAFGASPARPVVPFHDDNKIEGILAEFEDDARETA